MVFFEGEGTATVTLRISEVQAWQYPGLSCSRCGSCAPASASAGAASVIHSNTVFRCASMLNYHEMASGMGGRDHGE